VRWDRFFEDLEDQLSSEWEAERAALDSEAERLRLSRVQLRDRLRMLSTRDRTEAAPSLELADGSVFAAEVSAVGADWIGIVPVGQAGGVVVPIAAVSAIGMSHADLLGSARPVEHGSPLADRMTLGFVLRDLARRRAGVAVRLVDGRSLTGTIDRAGADHFDVALHDPGSPRRADQVTGHRLIPFTGIAWVRPELPSVVW
jgi:hypothetical protein